MKVYILWYIPDYIGIDIIAIYSKEDDAEKALKELRLRDPIIYRDCNTGFDEYDVL